MTLVIGGTGSLFVDSVLLWSNNFLITNAGLGLKVKVASRLSYDVRR